MWGRAEKADRQMAPYRCNPRGCGLGCVGYANSWEKGDVEVWRDLEMSGGGGGKRSVGLGRCIVAIHGRAVCRMNLYTVTQQPVAEETRGLTDSTFIWAIVTNSNIDATLRALRARLPPLV